MMVLEAPSHSSSFGADRGASEKSQGDVESELQYRNFVGPAGRQKDENREPKYTAIDDERKR
jgi:hypothetical protein